MVLQGRWERSTFSAEDVVNDAMMTSKPSHVKNTLDHFEKWMGVVKVDTTMLQSDKNYSPTDKEAADSDNSKCLAYSYCTPLYLL